MALDDFTLWQLSLIREVVEAASPRVSLSFFWWSKPPGNHYTTFYPTHWLPPRDDRAALGDASRGRDLFARTFGAERITLATYGDGELTIPWLPEGSRALVLSPSQDPDPRRAALRALDSLDLDWLASEGTSDPRASRVVLAWLDEILALARRPDVARAHMEFEFDERPSALTVLELRDRDDVRQEVRWREHEETSGA